MPNLVVAVLPNVERCRSVMDVWDRFGVPGVTILESLGMHRLKQAFNRRDDMPLLPSLRHLIESEEYHHRTIFTVVGDDFDLDGLLAATETAAERFQAPDSGIVFVVPVTRTLGLRPRRAAAKDL